MYEENRRPLPPGDAAVVFAAQLAEMQKRAAVERPPPVTPETVVRWADRGNQPLFAGICRRLLLPGSGVQGLASLRRLTELARDRQACLVCLNHLSTLDVPTLCTLLQDQGDGGLFERIAGHRVPGP